MTFSGPVADDGSLSANIAGSAPGKAPHHKRANGIPPADLTGKIEGSTFNGQVAIGRCTTPLMLTKS